jgi:hypothetical protein
MLFIPLFVTLCVKLDPGTHKGMHSVLAQKLGVTWCYPRNTFILSLCEPSPTPLCEDLVICEKSQVVS